MKTKVDINLVKENENNPRYISSANFDKLKKSIQEFPEMLEKRPIVVDEDYTALGGNMRLKACKEVGLEEIWIEVAEGWTEEQKREFVVKDNSSYGSWDWEVLANEWDAEQLNDWAVNVPRMDEELDYSILDEFEIDDEVDEMNSNVRKAIQIPFELEHYEEAFELVKYWREKGGYVGMMLIEKLKLEKDNEEN